VPRKILALGLETTRDAPTQFITNQQNRFSFRIIDSGRGGGLFGRVLKHPQLAQSFVQLILFVLLLLLFRTAACQLQ
jgi:hypothetical protein